MLRFFTIFLLITFFLIDPNLSFSQTAQQSLPEKTRILFLLDGSGSMLAKWENTYRIAVAKKLLSEFVDSLRADNNLELALRVYGHQYDRRQRRCDDTRLEVGFSAANHDQINNALRTIGPKGTTPIAYALEQASNDFPTDDKARNVIIIITDGIESCDGDPCAVSLALQRKNIFLKPFIIGIGMDKNFEEQFGCMGSFYDASNILAFKKALNKALFQSLGKTTVSVELLDIHDQRRETNVNVSFINHFTQTSAFEFVHYRDENGIPDTVEVDPVLNYDIVVNTIPPVKKSNVAIQAGEHNVLFLKSPQGKLGVQQAGNSEYKEGVFVLVKKHQEKEILTSFPLPGEEKLLVGYYDIICNTLPKVTIRNVHIKQSETTTIDLDQPGVVNFITSSPGIGSIYQVHKEGDQEWIHNLDQEKLRHTIAIQPGKYKVVFRSEHAKGSKFTSFKDFEIKSGSSLNIRL